MRQWYHTLLKAVAFGQRNNVPRWLNQIQKVQSLDCEQHLKCRVSDVSLIRISENLKSPISGIAGYRQMVEKQLSAEQLIDVKTLICRRVVVRSPI